MRKMKRGKFKHPRKKQLGIQTGSESPLDVYDAGRGNFF